MRIELSIITIRWIIMKNHISLTKMRYLSVESHANSILNNSKHTSRLKFMDLRYRKASFIYIPKISIKCKVASWWAYGTGPYLSFILITLKFYIILIKVCVIKLWLFLQYQKISGHYKGVFRWRENEQDGNNNINWLNNISG